MTWDPSGSEILIRGIAFCFVATYTSAVKECSVHPRSKIALELYGLRTRGAWSWVRSVGVVGEVDVDMGAETEQCPSVLVEN